jgi:hypothetical protein
MLQDAALLQALIPAYEVEESGGAVVLQVLLLQCLLLPQLSLPARCLPQQDQVVLLLWRYSGLLNLAPSLHPAWVHH